MPELYPSEISLDGLRRALIHSGWTSYIFVGRASERGWKEAQFLEMLAGKIRCYLIPESKREVLVSLALPPRAKGLVIGPGGEPVIKLSAAKTERASDVAKAVRAAQAQEVN